jgi:DNA-binding NarL/FixJ family response regulator
MQGARAKAEDIGIDAQSGLLALGLAQVVRDGLGVEPVLGSGVTASGLLIADFCPPAGQSEARIAELIRWAKRGRLLVIMLWRWDDVAVRLVRSGALGVLYPEASGAELLEAIALAQARRPYLPPVLQRTLAERYVASADGSVEGLTRRELQFVHKLAMGLSTSEIAQELGLSPKTADSHRANVLRKLGLRNNVEIARLAIRQGLSPL